MSLAEALKGQEEKLKKRRLSGLLQWSSRYKELVIYILHRNRGFLVGAFYGACRSFCELIVISVYLDMTIARYYFSWIIILLVNH